MGGVISDNQQVNKQQLDLELAKRIMQPISQGLKIPYITIGEFSYELPRPEFTSVAGSNTLMEASEEFFVSHYDEIIRKMDEANSDIVKIKGRIGGTTAEPSFYGDSIDYIITRSSVNSSHTSDGVVIKVECDSDIRFNSTFTMYPATEVLILYSLSYDKTGESPTTPTSYIVRTSDDTPPRYPEYIQVSNYGMIDSVEVTFMDAVVEQLLDMVIDISNFMDIRGTNKILLECWNYNRAVNGYCDLLEITRIQTMVSSQAVLCNFVVTSTEDHYWNKSVGLSSIHEKIIIDTYLGWATDKYGDNPSAHKAYVIRLSESIKEHTPN